MRRVRRASALIASCVLLAVLTGPAVAAADVTASMDQDWVYQRSAFGIDARWFVEVSETWVRQGSVMTHERHLSLTTETGWSGYNSVWMRGIRWVYITSPDLTRAWATGTVSVAPCIACEPTAGTAQVTVIFKPVRAPFREVLPCGYHSETETVATVIINGQVVVREVPGEQNVLGRCGPAQ